MLGEREEQEGMSENSGSLRKKNKHPQSKQHSLNRFVIVCQIYVTKTPYLKVVGIAP
jgi:hypothetical protein